MTTIDTGTVRARNEDGTIWWTGGGCWTTDPREAVLVLRSAFDAAQATFKQQRANDCPDNGFFGPYQCTFLPKPVQPFHAGVHEALLDAGYAYTRRPCTFEDDGDAESGPHLTGGPEHDQYEAPEQVAEQVMGTTLHSPVHTVYALPGGELDLVKYEPMPEWWHHGDEAAYGRGPQPSVDDLDPEEQQELTDAAAARANNGGDL